MTALRGQREGASPSRHSDGSHHHTIDRHAQYRPICEAGTNLHPKAPLGSRAFDLRLTFGKSSPQRSAGKTNTSTGLLGVCRGGADKHEDTRGEQGKSEKTKKWFHRYNPLSLGLPRASDSTTIATRLSLRGGVASLIGVNTAPLLPRTEIVSLGKIHADSFFLIPKVNEVLLDPL